MSVSVTEFQTYFLHINNDVNKSNWRIQYPWMLPALFSQLCSFNDPLCLEDDRILQIVPDSNRRQVHV